MAMGSPKKGRSIGVLLLRVLLGIVFLEVGITKLTGTAHTVDYFAAIGWGQWFRHLTGVLDIVGAVLLFVPRMTRYGAMVLTGSAGSASLISMTVLHGNRLWGGGVMVLVPTILCLLAALLACCPFGA